MYLGNEIAVCVKELGIFGNLEVSNSLFLNCASYKVPYPCSISLFNLESNFDMMPGLP